MNVGLPADEQERATVLIKDDPDYPPRVYVDHGRFAGIPHVLTDGEPTRVVCRDERHDPQDLSTKRRWSLAGLARTAGSICDLVFALHP